jgi:D-alanyl-D-alanine carboxypeptidase/D-alanyl-D-alanine-endopeptidase (penicillin-binding protein 4)
MKLSSSSAVVAALTAALLGGGVAVYGTRATAIADAARMRAAMDSLPPGGPVDARVIPADAAKPGGPLQAQAEALVGSGAAEWSLMAYSLDRKETLFAINADQPKIPASNNKVFGAVWALAELGPEYRFPTDLLVAGTIQGGVVNGDLVLRGSGDPAFGYPEYDRDPLKSLRVMAQALKSRGVTSVQGGIVADATIDDGKHYGPNWPNDTGNGAAQYAPTVSGLPYARNMLWVRLDPAAPGGVVTMPEGVTEIPVVWKQRSGRAMAARKPDNDTIIVRGAPGGRGNRYGVGANEPALLAPAALRQALREVGITVGGPIRLGKTPAGARLVHRHYSITLAEMTPQALRHSDNFFAEHFWKAAVAKNTGQGSYAKGGSASATFFHDRAGVPFGQLWQADGSGLSADNRTSAYALVLALSYGDQQPWKKVFHESLAVAGKPDGTMNRLFVGTPAEGNLHAKTGYIRGVRSLSGFVKTAGGETVVFAMIYNGRNTGGSRGIQANLGTLLASYTR